MLPAVFALRRCINFRKGCQTLVGLTAMAALMLPLTSRAAVFSDVFGTADASTVSGPGPTDFYGPVLSTAGNVASSSAADQIGLLQSSAASDAVGSVSSSTEGHATFSSSFGTSLGSWNGTYTNPTGAGSEFVLTAQWTRSVSSQAQRPTDVFVPQDFPGNVEPHADATLGGQFGYGATQVTFDSLAFGTYHFNVGFLAAGATLSLQLSVSSSASIDAG